jgi:hypothetical protein
VCNTFGGLAGLAGNTFLRTPEGGKPKVFPANPALHLSTFGGLGGQAGQLGQQDRGTKAGKGGLGVRKKVESWRAFTPYGGTKERWTRGTEKPLVCTGGKTTPINQSLRLFY